MGASLHKQLHLSKPHSILRGSFRRIDYEEIQRSLCWLEFQAKLFFERCKN